MCSIPTTRSNIAIAGRQTVFLPLPGTPNFPRPIPLCLDFSIQGELSRRDRDSLPLEIVERLLFRGDWSCVLLIPYMTRLAALSFVTEGFFLLLDKIT